MKRVAHRNERENPRKERNHLRQENRELKRKVARLQKRVNRFEESEEQQMDGLEMASEPTVESSSRSSSSDVCPVCGAEGLLQWTAPSGKVIVGCKSCKKYRKNNGGS